MMTDYQRARDEIAQAACRVCDIDTPMLAGDTPRAERVYLFATPAGEGGALSVDGLSREIAQAGIPVGVDRDPDSATRGVRFTATFAPLTDGLKRYATPAARRSWQAWREGQNAMAADVARAASHGIEGAKPVRTRTEREDDER